MMKVSNTWRVTVPPSASLALRRHLVVTDGGHLVRLQHFNVEALFKFPTVTVSRVPSQTTVSSQEVDNKTRHIGEWLLALCHVAWDCGTSGVYVITADIL